MANMLQWIRCTKAQFDAIVTKDLNALYFVQDTNEIYNGSKSFTELAIMVDTLPTTGMIPGKIYIETATFSGSMWDVSKEPAAWVNVIKPIVDTLDDTDTTSNVLATGRAIKEYVNAKVAEIVAGGGVNTDNIKLAKDITVKGQSLGGYEDGDIIPGGTILSDYLQGIAAKRIAATYSAPTVSITPNSTSVECGTSVNPTVNASFTQRDAGALNNYTLDRLVTGSASEEVVNNPTISPYSQPAIVVGEGSNYIRYTATVSYDTGVLKQDNLGNDSPEGRIMAGEKTAVCNYSGYRKAFYGVENDVAVAHTTSEAIRALPTSTNATLAANTTLEIVCPIGTTMVTIAYDATIRDITSAVNELGFNILDIFSKTEVDVEGAAGYTAKTYKVFTFVPAAPFSVASTYTIKI